MGDLIEQYFNGENRNYNQVITSEIYGSYLKNQIRLKDVAENFKKMLTLFHDQCQTDSHL